MEPRLPPTPPLLPYDFSASLMDERKDISISGFVALATTPITSDRLAFASPDCSASMRDAPMNNGIVAGATLLMSIETLPTLIEYNCSPLSWRKVS